MNRYTLAAILLCGAILTGFTGCADSTGRRQTRVENSPLNIGEPTLPPTAGWTSAAPATESNTAGEEKPPETDRKPAAEPSTVSPTPQTFVSTETPPTSTAPTTSPATFRTPEISTPSPEPSQTPATTQPPLPDVSLVSGTTEKPTPAPTQAPDKPSPTPETEPPQPSRPPEPENPAPDAERMAQRLLELLNAERAKVEARPLSTGDRLRQMAQVRADELTVLFDHDRPNGEPSRTIYTEFEYGNRYDYTDLGFGTVYYPAHYGEDIGQTTLGEGGGIDEAVRSMTEGFRGSPEHWSDLMDPVYGAAGVAVSVERIDMGEGFPALYRCNFEVLLIDRLYE